MDFEDFLQRLEGVVQTSGGYQAICPAHPDQNPSMSVKKGDKGGILVHCHAGCTSEAIVEAMGLKMADLMPNDGKRGLKGRASGRKAKEPKAIAVEDIAAKEPGAVSAETILSPSPLPRKKRERGEFVARYVYHGEDGKAIYCVERRKKADGSKTFEQLTRDDDPKAYGYDASLGYGWKFGLTKWGTKRVPFRLPRVLKAAKDGKTVIVLEGEKDVLNAEKALGCACTCNAGGASKPGDLKKWEAGWSKYFEGAKSVIIVADKDAIVKKDEKTGLEKLHAVGQIHANNVERLLLEGGFKGRIVKVALPDVEGTHVKDFTEWMEARQKHGFAIDQAAFLEAVKANAWEADWNKYGVGDIHAIENGVKAADKKAKGKKAAEEDKAAARTDGRGRMGEAGRFGRRSPRAPFEKRGWYQVDFQMDPKEIARFDVGRDGIHFEGWKRSESGEDRGEFVKMAEYDEIKCPPSRMLNMAVGCLTSFNDKFKLVASSRTDLTSSLMLAWLRARGKFFADIDNPMYETSMYFDSQEGVLYNIHSDEFLSFLATASNVSRKNKTFENLVALIEDLTMDVEQTPRVRPSKEWDRVGDTIYISNGDSRMYKITESEIKEVANGEDGVVFLRGATLSPWKYRPGEGIDPFSHSKIFLGSTLKTESDMMNLRLYTLNLFACHTNKPILLVNGPKGSGKTLLVQAVKQMLGIRTDGQDDFTVNRMEHSDKGSDDFWIIVDKGRFEIFDNFDYKIKWADNDLQTAATNGASKRRALYETNVLVTLYARAYIALTSNNATFASEGGGLPDRIITITTEGRPERSADPEELFRYTSQYRDNYFSWIVETLKATLADKEPVDEMINKRHPAYSNFSIRLGRAFGNEAGVIRALSTAEIEKAVLPLMNDAVAKEIVAVLMSQEPVAANFSFSASEMSKAIVERLGEEDTDEKTRTIFGSRRIGKTLAKFRDDFSVLFKWSSRLLEGITKYEFTGLTARGETVEKSLRGGLVDFEGQNEKSPIVSEEGAGFVKNGSINPPNPPHARAQSLSQPFYVKEESNRNITDSLENGGDLEGIEL